MNPGRLRAPPRSILLVRLSARGDLVFASPLVRAFRRTYPDAKLTWMAESHTKDLVENHPELDDVIVVDRLGWKRLWRQGRWGTLLREMKEFLGSLRHREFDVAIDLQGLLRSGVLTYLSGAPIRIGLRSKEGSGVFMTQVLSQIEGDRRNIGTEYRYLADVLDLDVGPFEMEVALSDSDQRWAGRKRGEMGIEGGYCVALPFTTTPQKHWREDRWAALMDRVTEELGLPTVILGGPDDEPALERIRSMAQSSPITLVGKTTLAQAGAMVEGASLVIGVDTGLTHMGIAFQRPTVSLFGSNIPYTITPNPRSKVVVHWLECSPCRGNPTCNGAFTCTDLITVDQVMGTAREVLLHAPPRRKASGDPAPDPGEGS